MKKMKLIYLCCILGIMGSSSVFAQSGDKLLDMLSGELNKHYQELQGEKLPPYYMNYRIIDKWSTIISASFGMLNDNQFRHSMKVLETKA